MASPQPNSGLTKMEIHLRPSDMKGKPVSYFVMIEEHHENSLMEAIRQDDSVLLKKLLPDEDDILDPGAGGRLIQYASEVKSVECSKVLVETMGNCGRNLRQIFPLGGGSKRVLIPSNASTSTSANNGILSPSQYFVFQRTVFHILMDRGLCQVCRVYDGTNPVELCHHKVCDKCVRVFGPERARNCFVCKPLAWATVALPDPVTSADKENAQPYALTSQDKENA